MVKKTAAFHQLVNWTNAQTIKSGKGNTRVLELETNYEFIMVKLKTIEKFLPQEQSCDLQPSPQSPILMPAGSTRLPDSSHFFYFLLNDTPPFLPVSLLYTHMPVVQPSSNSPLFLLFKCQLVQQLLHYRCQLVQTVFLLLLFFLFKCQLVQQVPLLLHFKCQLVQQVPYYSTSSAN